MYGEDMDLCYRARLAGRSNYYVGSAAVIHHGGQSSTATADRHWSAVVMRESVFGFMKAHRGVWYARSYRCVTAVVAFGRIVLVGATMMLPLTPERHQALAQAAAKWNRILRWACGLERWAQQL
jgi:GT2 family glycosyltransferase